MRWDVILSQYLQCRNQKGLQILGYEKYYINAHCRWDFCEVRRRWDFEYVPDLSDDDATNM